MKCLYCGKKLTLLRKLKDSEFCKDEHRTLYMREQEQMAVARLKGAQLWAKGEKADREEAEKAKVEAAQAAPEVRAGLKGFLPLLPHVLSRKGFLRLRPDSLPQLPDVWVPELLTPLRLGQLRADAVEIPVAVPAPPAATLKFEAEFLEWAIAVQMPRFVETPRAGLLSIGSGSDTRSWLQSGNISNVSYMEPALPWPLAIGMLAMPEAAWREAALAKADGVEWRMEPEPRVAEAAKVLDPGAVAEEAAAAPPTHPAVRLRVATELAAIDEDPAVDVASAPGHVEAATEFEASVAPQTEPAVEFEALGFEAEPEFEAEAVAAVEPTLGALQVEAGVDGETLPLQVEPQFEGEALGAAEPALDEPQIEAAVEFEALLLQAGPAFEAEALVAAEPAVDVPQTEAAVDFEALPLQAIPRFEVEAPAEVEPAASALQVEAAVEVEALPLPAAPAIGAEALPAAEPAVDVPQTEAAVDFEALPLQAIPRFEVEAPAEVEPAASALQVEAAVEVEALPLPAAPAIGAEALPAAEPAVDVPQTEAAVDFEALPLQAIPRFEVEAPAEVEPAASALQVEAAVEVEALPLPAAPAIGAEALPAAESSVVAPQTEAAFDFEALPLQAVPQVEVEAPAVFAPAVVEASVEVEPVPLQSAPAIEVDALAAAEPTLVEPQINATPEFAADDEAVEPEPLAALDLLALALPEPRIAQLAATVATHPEPDFHSAVPDLAFPQFLTNAKRAAAVPQPPIEAEPAFLALPMPEFESDFVAVPEAPAPLDPPAAIEIYPLGEPAAQSTRRQLRKPRPREIFFSTPRLHDMPALAAAVARTNQGAKLATPGSQPWNAGVLPAGSPRQSDSSAIHPHPIEAAGPLEPATPTVAALPLLAIPSSSVQLVSVGETLIEIALPLRVPAPPSVAEVLVACASWNSDVQEPVLAATLPELVLAAAGLTTARTVEAAPSAGLRIVAFDPTPSDPPEPTVFETPRLSTLRPATGVRGSDLVLPGLPAGLGGNHNPRGWEPEFEPLPTVAPTTSYPPLNRLSGGVPPVVTEMWPLQPGNPLPYPAGTVAVQSVDAAWPEGNAQLPRLDADVAPDPKLREHGTSRSTGRPSTGRRSWMPGGFALPSFSLPARPDAKWLVMLVPVGLLLAVYTLTGDGNKRRGPVDTAQVATSSPAETTESSTPAVNLTPASGTKRRRKIAAAEPAGPPPPVAIVPATADANAGFSDGLKSSIMRRAAISFTDDFRTGLADWQGGDNWSTQWSYDAAGFVNTGPLALYTPSMSLTNYRMEFLGQIDKKSLGWVFRARDLRNYYVTKITLVRGGPLPSAVIEHYTVLDGKESRHEKRPLPIQIRTDTLYRVKMDVNDEDFTLTVQGQVVDHWSDSSLKHGGIGFFSAKGELARLRWVEVSHQYDFLGRLCALLVPYQIPARDGSAK